MAVGIALVMAGELLTTVSGIVLAWKLGNLVPLLMVTGTTLVFLRLSSHLNKDTVLRTIMNVLGWTSAVFLVFTVLLIALPYGVYIAIPAGAGVAIGCRVVQDPSAISANLSDVLGSSVFSAMSSSKSLSMISDRGASTVWDTTQNLPLRAILLPKGCRENIVTIMKERPKLPVTLEHFEEDFLIVNIREDEGWLARVEGVLNEVGIKGHRRLSATFGRVVVTLPLLEQGHGITLEDYRIVHDSESVDRLVKRWPKRIALFPNMNGLVALVTESSSPGLNSMEIPKGLLLTVIVGRDISKLKIGDEKNGNTA